VLALDEPPRVLRAGCITTKPDPRSTHTYQADKDGARVDTIAAELLEVLRTELLAGGVVMVAIEAPAGSKSMGAVKALGLAYGIARTACCAHGLTPITVQAHEVKLVVGGSKGASKDDVAAGVLRLTEWKSVAGTAPAREGESDAVGVALTAMRHPIAAALSRRSAA
jgi:Holliday junction resolvasome RuvABC endonuclease subunit